MAEAARKLKLVGAEDYRKRGPIPTETEGTAQDLVRSGAPKKTARVKKNPDMNAAWDQIVPPLVEAGLLSPADAPALEMAIMHYAASCLAADELFSVGPTTEDRFGCSVKNPADVVFRGESGLFLKYCQQMGLTFASRVRTQMPDEGKDDSNPFA